MSFSPAQVLADEYGRYLIVPGTVMQIRVVSVNVYVPNFDDAEFVNKLFNTLPCFNTHTVDSGGRLELITRSV